DPDATVEDRLLQPRREEEREHVSALVDRPRRLPVAAAQALRDELLVEDGECRLRPLEVDRRPVPLLRMADLDLARMGVTLGMAVEELAEQGPARALDLRDEHERLADRDDVVEPRAAKG